MAASSSRDSAIPLSAASIVAARCSGEVAAQAGYAALAALTASLTSWVLANAARPTTTPGLAGSAITIFSAVWRSLPPMYNGVETELVTLSILFD